jgi:nucleotide-binding universal stress UspA family protein
LFLEAKARQLPGVDVETRVEVLNHGEELDQRIATVASAIDADMVMVVSSRISGTVGFVLGSFAHAIVSRSPSPVLIVGPEG